MFISSERKDWEEGLNNFPGIEYYNVLNNSNNITILRCGTITGSQVYDLFIVFKYNGFTFNFAMKNSEWSFKIQTGNQWECSGSGLEDFKECVNIIFNDTQFIKSSLKQPIYSFTLKELRDAEDMNFIHRGERIKELSEPTLEYAYCNTLKFKIKSSHYGEKVGGGTNTTEYTVFVLFEDFYTIGKDKDIDFEDAIDYAINFGDCKIRCTCPSMLYWGFSYQGTSLKYLYGIPREGRFPKIRNPKLKGTMCKHCDVVVDWILKHKDIIAKMFALYYNRLNDGQSIYAVNTNGTTITIGKKNENGDVFFERQAEEQEEQNMKEAPEEQVEETVEEQDFDVMEPDTWFEDEDNVTDIEEE